MGVYSQMDAELRYVGLSNFDGEYAAHATAILKELKTPFVLYTKIIWQLLKMYVFQLYKNSTKEAETMLIAIDHGNKLILFSCNYNSEEFKKTKTFASFLIKYRDYTFTR